MVPPLRIKIPSGPMFCLVKVFWTAEAKRPIPPVIMVVLIAAEIAS